MLLCQKSSESWNDYRDVYYRGIYICVNETFIVSIQFGTHQKNSLKGKLSTKYAVEVWLNTECQCQESIKDPPISTTTRFLSLAVRLPVLNLLSLLLIETTRVCAESAHKTPVWLGEILALKFKVDLIEFWNDPQPILGPGFF